MERNTLPPLQHIVQFVEESDVHVATLSVRQTFMFAAECLIPDFFPFADKVHHRGQRYDARRQWWREEARDHRRDDVAPLQPDLDVGPVDARSGRGHRDGPAGAGDDHRETAPHYRHIGDATTEPGDLQFVRQGDADGGRQDPVLWADQGCGTLLLRDRLSTAAQAPAARVSGHHRRSGAVGAVHPAGRAVRGAGQAVPAQLAAKTHPPDRHLFQAGGAHAAALAVLSGRAHLSLCGAGHCDWVSVLRPQQGPAQCDRARRTYLPHPAHRGCGRFLVHHRRGRHVASGAQTAPRRLLRDAALLFLAVGAGHPHAVSGDVPVSGDRHSHDQTAGRPAVWLRDPHRVAGGHGGEHPSQGGGVRDAVRRYRAGDRQSIDHADGAERGLSGHAAQHPRLPHLGLLDQPRAATVRGATGVSGVSDHRRHPVHLEAVRVLVEPVLQVEGRGDRHRILFRFHRHRLHSADGGALAAAAAVQGRSRGGVQCRRGDLYRERGARAFSLGASLDGEGSQGVAGEAIPESPRRRAEHQRSLPDAIASHPPPSATPRDGWHSSPPVPVRIRLALVRQARMEQRLAEIDGHIGKRLQNGIVAGGVDGRILAPPRLLRQQLLRHHAAAGASVRPPQPWERRRKHNVVFAGSHRRPVHRAALPERLNHRRDGGARCGRQTVREGGEVGHEEAVAVRERARQVAQQAGGVGGHVDGPGYVVRRGHARITRGCAAGAGRQHRLVQAVKQVAQKGHRARQRMHARGERGRLFMSAFRRARRLLRLVIRPQSPHATGIQNVLVLQQLVRETALGVD
eukprot:ctg_740.g178